MERHHPHALDSQRRKHLIYVSGQAHAVCDYKQTVRNVPIGKRVCQIGQPVKTDRRLAAAGAPLNDHHPRLARRNDVELARIDQGGDLGQMPIEMLPMLRRGAENAAWPENTSRAGRAGFTTRQLVGGQIGPLPPAAGPVRSRPTLHPDTLRTSDAQQRTALDRHRPANDDLSFDVSFTETFLVLAPFAVTVEQLANRRVPPVDDIYARLGIDECRAADENVSVDEAASLHLFAQAQMTEIRGGRVDQNRLQLRAGQCDVLEAFHLRDQCRNILQARLSDLVAQRHHLVDVATIGA